MNAFSFILPRPLLETLGPAKHGEDIGAVIVDLAAGGLLDGRARYIIDHRYVDSAPQQDALITSDQWQRIIYEDRVSEVWSTGNARMLKGDAKNHIYPIEIVGIRFEEGLVREALKQHGIALERDAEHAAPVEVPPVEVQPVSAAVVPIPTAKKPAARIAPSPPAKPVDAITTVADYKVLAGLPIDDQPSPPPPANNAAGVSVDEAARMIGIGRTSVYERINDGTLDAKKVGRRTIITIQSIKRLLGLP